MSRAKPKTSPNEQAAVAALDHQYPPDKLHSQIIRYYLFGAFNTAVDFVMLNIGIYALHLPVVFANALGISTALLTGYFINRKLVFRHSQPRHKRHYGYYLVINLASLYGLQTGVLLLLGHYTLVESTITGFAVTLIHVPFDTLQNNVAKLIAALTTGVWNFALFRKFVFNHKVDRKQPA